MKPFDQVSGAGVLAVILGLTGASCATQKSATLIKDRLLPHEQQVATSTSREPDSTTQAKIQATYAYLPLHFEPNQGQTDGQVHFLSRGRGYTLFLTSTEAVLALRKPAQRDTETIAASQLPPTSNLQSPPPDAGEGGGVVLRMQLLGANPNPQVMGLDELPGKSNYFIGNDPTKWHTNIPTYAMIKPRGGQPHRVAPTD